MLGYIYCRCLWWFGYRSVFIYALRPVARVHDTIGAMESPTSFKRTRAFMFALAASQIVFCLAALGTLIEAKTRTGWAQTFGATAASIGALEGLVSCVSRARGPRGVLVNAFTSASCILVSVGIVGLVCNTEDGEHPDQGPVDNIERGACVLIVGWGLLLTRIGADFVEEEARSECAYELKFETQP